MACRERGFEHLAYRDSGGKTRILRHIGSAGPLAHGKLAGVRLDLAGKDREQRGFSRTVGPDKPNAVAVLHNERDVAKQGLCAELFSQRLRV